MWYEIPFSTARMMAWALRRLAEELSSTTRNLCVSHPMGGAVVVLQNSLAGAEELAGTLETAVERALGEAQPVIRYFLAPMDATAVVQALTSYQDSLDDPTLYELPMTIQTLAGGLEPPRYVRLPDAQPDKDDPVHQGEGRLPGGVASA